MTSCQHDWHIGTTTWKPPGGGIGREKLTQVHRECPRCGKHRWRMVGWWNRRRWLALLGPHEQGRITNPACFFCCDWNARPPFLGGKCSRCQQPVDRPRVIGDMWADGGGRYSYLCVSCGDEFGAWFYGTNRLDEVPTRGWLFAVPRKEDAA